MQACSLILSFSILLVSCQGNQAKTSIAPDTTLTIGTQITDTINTSQDTLPPGPANNKLKLALASNALQIVDAVTGSTKEITFGMPFDQLEAIIVRILESKPTSVGVNNECGAGPLKMATWPNGLTLVFKEKTKDNADWLFAGWFISMPKVKGDKPATMAGIGVGSTLEELEKAYVISVTKTTLGQEFSIRSGLYGILSGAGKKAAIDAMWSGTSCNFR